jgi:phage host-nuclease inhibitor protein Gam
MIRLKLKPPVDIPASRAEAEAVLRRIAEVKLEETALKAEMDEQLTRTRKQYEARLAKLQDQLLRMLESLRAWAEAHPEEFGGRRSLEMLHGTLGWRLTPPALRPVRGFTWGAVFSRLKELGKWEYIRTKEEPNREALLAARETENLRELYLEVVQRDEFYVEPRLSPAQSRETVNG